MSNQTCSTGVPSRGFIPPALAVGRAPPTYNEVAQSQHVINLNGLAQLDGTNQEEGAAAALPLHSLDGKKTTPIDGATASSNPFDDFIVEGYEDVTYEPSKLI